MATITDIAQIIGDDMKHTIKDNVSDVQEIIGDLKVNSLTETSSKKFKEDIQPIDPEKAFEMITQLQGVLYTWKDSGKKDIGFIAEDVLEVIPEIVLIDESGETKGLNYGKITSILVAAMQYQNERIKNLEDKLNNEN